MSRNTFTANQRTVNVMCGQGYFGNGMKGQKALDICSF